MSHNKIILLFTTLIFVLQSPVTLAKEVITRYKSGKVESTYQIDEKGEKHGRYQLFDEQGNLATEGYYNHGKKDGFWNEQELDGYKEKTATATGYYKNDVAVGTWRRILVDGRVGITHYNKYGEGHGLAYAVDKYGALIYMSYVIDGDNSELCSDDFLHRLSSGC